MSTLPAMAMTHSTFCDGNHTDRQACNRALESSEGAAPAIPSPVVTDIGNERTTVLEAPPRVEQAATAPDAALTRDVSPDAEPLADIPIPRDWRLEMPTPSPWALRAWEDTAAAVGATPLPAQPPQAPTGDSVDDSNRSSMRAQLGLLAGVATAAAVAMFLVRSRRRT